MIGINWGISPLPRMILPSLALTLPPLTWLSLKDLSQGTKTELHWKVLGLITLLILVMNVAGLAGWAWVTDIINIGTYSGYGALLIWQGCSKNEEAFEDYPLYLIRSSQQAYLGAGAILLFSALIDIAVTIDLWINRGSYAPLLVGYSNVIFLLGLLFLFFRESYLGRPSIPNMPPKALLLSENQSIDEAMHKEIMGKLDREMVENKLYRVENLTLRRLGSRIGISPRQISTAINSICALSVPQYVNTFRIREACKILTETDMPITDIVFAVGFTTKSNFNREFLRITGLSPSAWRNQALEKRIASHSADPDQKPA